MRHSHCVRTRLQSSLSGPSCGFGKHRVRSVEGRDLKTTRGQSQRHFASTTAHIERATKCVGW
jgi:hypothetical protein